MRNVLIMVGMLIVVAVTFLLFMRNPNSTKNIKNYPSSGTNIIAFGDSLVEGTGSSQDNDFVSVLSRQLNIPIENLGRAGDTTDAAKGRLNEVLERDPKVVLLLLGGNDYLRQIPKEEIFSNLGIIIESIQNSGAIVILLGVKGGILRDNYKSDFKKLSIQYQTVYIENVLDGIISNPDLMYDSIHPNNDGYKIIADRIYPVIKNLID